jgi:Protein of unknown function (DUF2442)
MTGLTPDITAVRVVRHGAVVLTFADGLQGEADLLERMHGPVFANARTPEGFSKVRVDPELGTIVWPGGADLAPDTLYVRVRTGTWPDSRAAA